MHEILEGLFQQTTQGEWKIRSLGAGGDIFIEAPKVDPTFAYNIEVFGDDEAGYPTKHQDLIWASALHNAFPEIMVVIQAALKLQSEFEQDGNHAANAVMCGELFPALDKMKALDLRASATGGEQPTG